MNKESIVMSNIEWLKKQFKLAGMPFNDETVKEIDKIITFSALTFNLSYSETFYRVLTFIGNGDDVYEGFRKMDRRNKNGK